MHQTHSGSNNKPSSQPSPIRLRASAAARQEGRRSSKLRGFTLVELSISLVVVALMIGGVLVARTMIENAEINSVYSQITQYTVAINAFQTKYDAMPGDMANATHIWGASSQASGCNPALNPEIGVLNAATGTCNGDGNGQVSSSNTGNSDRRLVWEHLSLAGVIPETYRYRIPFTETTSMGIGFPKTIRNAGIMFWFVDAGVYSVQRHSFSIGAYAAGSGGLADGFLTAREALAFDQKYDDGRPGAGKILSNGSYTNSVAPINMPVAQRCPGVNGISSNPNAVYNVASTDLCRLVIGFE